ncbi:MAG: acyl carrier protein [Syntrophobacteraceae bacterium]|nr:acyl carrier protein [Desulfobacteraceae bacterium]
MIQSEMESIVVETFSLVMKQPFGLNEEVVRGRESAWTSLKHIELILALEEKFDIRFTEDEMVELKSLSTVKATVSKHLL